MFDSIRNLFRSPPKQRDSGLGAGMSDQDDDRFPTFQNAWKQGATFEDMFGDKPFQLHGSVGGSGADNHRPDVAKVETFLGDAGFYKPMTSDGPTGWHNTNLDSAIKGFQKANGLKVDGLLKPNGPTITRIGGLLGGQTQPQQQPKPQADILPMPGDPDYRPPGGAASAPKPQPNPGGIWASPQLDPQEGMLTPEQSLEALIRLMGGQQPQPQPPVAQPAPQPPTGSPPRRPLPPQDDPTEIYRTPPTFPERPIKTGHPDIEPLSTFDPKAEAKRWMKWFDENPRQPAQSPRPEPRDPFPGHDIDEEGAAEHDRYAQALVNDSDPSKTAAFLKNVTEWEGDRGRGDVADLLGRFHKVDPDKATHLQSELHKLTGSRIPFRVAPTRPNTGGPMADLADGDSESVRLPKSNPWGSAEAADRWEAGNMAKVLLGRTDYKDAVKHFAGEFSRDPAAAKPYTAAVFEEIAKSSPKQAVQFAGQMKAAGLVEHKEAETQPEQKPTQPIQPGTTSEQEPAVTPPQHPTGDVLTVSIPPELAGLPPETPEVGEKPIQVAGPPPKGPWGAKPPKLPDNTEEKLETSQQGGQPERKPTEKDPATALAQGLGIDPESVDLKDPRVVSGLVGVASYPEIRGDAKKEASVNSLIQNLIQNPETRKAGLALQDARNQGLANKEMVPAQMTAKELEEAIARNTAAGLMLSGGGAVVSNPITGTALGLTGEIFANKVEQMKSEWERKTGRKWPKLP